ncbi:MAG: hypothetical protein CSA07_04470 [Bacteroidia bacterium]|nr:MAG: hypothetical protein CSA07_04470 [Bacteroidia bacterium]
MEHLIVDETGALAPVVTVQVLAYNHADFLGQCLEGIAAQETDFPIECIVHDDASQDGTADVARAYQHRYPGLFRLVLEEENQYSQGVELYYRMNELSRGQYVAYCEGDDYWTDPRKLQLQHDFLAAHPDVLFVSTRYRSTHLDSEELTDEVFPLLFDRWKGKDGNVEIDLSGSFHATWLARTLTIMFRREAYPPREFAEQMTDYRDVQALTHFLMHGRGVCLPACTGVYRSHSGGVYTGLSHERRFYADMVSREELYVYSCSPMFLYWHARYANRLRRVGRSDQARDSLRRLYPRALWDLARGALRAFWLKALRKFE